jgi:hypothetical protein
VGRRGAPVPGAFEWKKKNWAKYLGAHSVLESLPNPIDREGVLDSFRLIRDPDSALDAYIASYLWGNANAGLGPYRAERVIRRNTDLESGKTWRLSCIHSLTSPQAVAATQRLSMSLETTKGQKILRSVGAREPYEGATRF